jgi:tungstate transport system substrate-binding protein
MTQKRMKQLKRMFNQYGVMLVNPARFPHVKKELGQAFIDWLISPDGQKAITDYKIGAQQLFFPNANVSEECSVVSSQQCW